MVVRHYIGYLITIFYLYPLFDIQIFEKVFWQAKNKFEHELFLYQIAEILGYSDIGTDLNVNSAPYPGVGYFSPMYNTTMKIKNLDKLRERVIQ